MIKDKYHVINAIIAVFNNIFEKHDLLFDRVEVMWGNKFINKVCLIKILNHNISYIKIIMLSKALGRQMKAGIHT